MLTRAEPSNTDFDGYVTVTVSAPACQHCLRNKALVFDVVFLFCRRVPSPIWIRLIERIDSISWQSPATAIGSAGHEPSSPWSHILWQTAETSLRHSQDIPPVPFRYVCNKCGRPEVVPGGQKIFSVRFFRSAPQLGALPRRSVHKAADRYDLLSFCREIVDFQLGQYSYADFIGITVLPCG